MTRALAAAVLSVGLVVGLASAASADDKDKDKNKTVKVEPFRVEPFHFGQGALSGWIRGAGEPNQKDDPGQFGFYLQKHTATSNFSAAGAELTGNIPKSGDQLNALAFDISGFPGIPFDDPNFPSHGYCNNGAPRFNVFSDAGTCFLGCAFGNKTQNSSGWFEIKFSTPFTQYPGCGVGVSTNIAGIEVILDDGNDLALPPPATGNSPGDVVLDNIRVNDKVVGKPKDDD